MISSKTLFIISIIVVILVLISTIILGPDPSILRETIIVEADSCQNTENTADSTNNKLTDIKSSQSFSFIGFKTNREGPKNIKIQNIKSGDNKTKEGVLPELTIELGDFDLETIAVRLRYLLVAADQEKILCKIVNGKLIQVTETELKKYSSRARDAAGLTNYFNLREKVAAALKKPESYIRLMYLVPNSVENMFIENQKKIIQSSNIQASSITLMVARYTPDLNIQITEVITKDGKNISIY